MTSSETARKLSDDERRLLARANALLPKYGGLRIGALNQATLLLGLELDAGDFRDLEPLVGARCEHVGTAEYGEWRCGRYVGHDGDHEPGCSECWQRFHPRGFGDGLEVNAQNPLCPIRNLPCCREPLDALIGRSCVVRRRGEAWVVAEVVDTMLPIGREGTRWLLRYPAGNEMVVDPRVVSFQNRRRKD